MKDAVTGFVIVAVAAIIVAGSVFMAWNWQESDRAQRLTCIQQGGIFSDRNAACQWSKP